MARILVVEDDAQTANEITAALTDHGFTADVASTGREGLLKAAAEPYDAIVLDRMLPGGTDGLGVLTALRAASIEAPVLILSALSAVDERVRGLRAGGDDYMTKPFDFLELAARLDILLRRHAGPQRETVLRAGRLEMDLLKHTIYLAAGSPVDLAAARVSPARISDATPGAGDIARFTMLFEEDVELSLQEPRAHQRHRRSYKQAAPQTRSR